MVDPHGGAQAGPAFHQRRRRFAPIAEVQFVLAARADAQRLVKLAASGIHIGKLAVFALAHLQHQTGELLKALVLLAITLYQRLLSPYKGYRCAYAACTGRASCSALGYRAIRRFGVRDGLGLLDARLHKCGIAHQRYRAPPGQAMASQAGFLDCDCALPSADCLGDACQCASCDWNRKRKTSNRKPVVIPPRSSQRR